MHRNINIIGLSSMGLALNIHFVIDFLVCDGVLNIPLNLFFNFLIADLGIDINKVFIFRCSQYIFLNSNPTKFKVSYSMSIIFVFVSFIHKPRRTKNFFKFLRFFITVSLFLQSTTRSSANRTTEAACSLSAQGPRWLQAA